MQPLSRGRHAVKSYRCSVPNRRCRLNPALASDIARDLFPATEAAVIADLIARDAPYYDAAIGQDAIARMIDFSHAAGILNARQPMKRLSPRFAAMGGKILRRRRLSRGPHDPL